MTNSTRYVAILVWASVMLFSADLHTVWANGGCGGMAMMGGHMHEGHDHSNTDEDADDELTHLLTHRQEIGLTSEQIGKLKTMQLDLNRAQARAEADIKVATLELHAIAEDKQADSAAIQAKVDQLKKAEGRLQFMAIRSGRSAIAILTPEQREKNNVLRNALMEGMEAGQDQHNGGMGGMRGAGRMGADRSKAGKGEGIRKAEAAAHQH